MHCAAAVSKRVTLRHASARRRAVTVTAAVALFSSCTNTPPPHFVMRARGELRYVASGLHRGPALVPANNAHRGIQ